MYNTDNYTIDNKCDYDVLFVKSNTDTEQVTKIIRSKTTSDKNNYVHVHVVLYYMYVCL